MALPRAFKSDESFLEKIAMGAIGAQRTLQDLERQGHQPMELERGSTSFKIWKAIKIKRVRMPDLLCLRCGHRVESRAKSKLEISMSHSKAQPERGWDHGLSNEDHVALVLCERSGPNPLDWVASELVQYIPVAALRQAFEAGQVRTEKPKGGEEGFEVRVTWPAAVASAEAEVEAVDERGIRYRPEGGRAVAVRLQRREIQLMPLVEPGAHVRAGQILAAVVPVSGRHECVGGAGIEMYIEQSRSISQTDRLAAVKALGRFEGTAATEALLARVEAQGEHVFVRVDAAAGLLRCGHAAGYGVLGNMLQDEYLQNRLEAVIVLGEVGGPEATKLLLGALQDADQHAEIRAGVAWSLGEMGAREALPALVQSFTALETVIKLEAARALTKLARGQIEPVVEALTAGAVEERPGIAWALSKAGGVRVGQLLPALKDSDTREWVAYIIGTQAKEAMLPEIEALAKQDPEVYFAVTVLWKILASWIYGLEEY